MQNASLSGSRYILTFIDDATRMVWVYFLKAKSEVFQTFKKFKNLVENQASCRIKKLRTDRGTEYLSREFTNFLEENGIKRQLTATYSPQQNGVSERRNRTLVEMARAMIKFKNLPLKFWAEAVHTAAYVQNRTTTRAIRSITPLEAWNGTKPSVNHMRVFGSVCYVLIPDEKRRKWDDKSKKAIFVGYSSQTKGYRVYLLEENKVDISRNVIFQERSRWDWEKKEVIKHLSVSSELEVIKEGTRTDEPEPSDYEPGERRNTQPSSPNQVSVNSEEKSNRLNRVLDSPSSSPPNRKIRGMDDLLLSAPYTDTEYSAVTEGCYSSFEEPTLFDEAVKHKEWREAMKEEIHMIEKNQTWELVKRPLNKNIVGVKWIYRLKTDAKGEVIDVRSFQGS